MKLNIAVKYVKNFDNWRVTELLRYRGDDDTVVVDIDLFSDKELKSLLTQLQEDNQTGAIRKIKAYQKMAADPKATAIHRLEQLTVVLTEYIRPSPNKWLFNVHKDGYVLPYFVDSITYSKGTRTSRPNVTVVLDACGYKGSDAGMELIVYDFSLDGSNIQEMLLRRDLFLETPELHQQYEKEVAYFKVHSNLIGKQYLCRGSGTGTTGWQNDNVSMVIDGQPVRVVIDNSVDSRTRETGSHGSMKFWEKKSSKSKSEDDDEELQLPVKPVHPIVQVFDLQRHIEVFAHIANLTPYEYDSTAADKLVLPKIDKDLIATLVRGTSAKLEDIVRGKTGGTIVISTGPPGTGKTLTAEVFAEKIQRPLYVVQCSQLGTNEEKLEQELEAVLQRASRWEAILLIDEADVYVHERGSSVQQNAIVGVFLRLLERYRGVLFLTSNRETIIDDAIMSRAIAWIRYGHPNAEELTQLWRVLSTQYKVALDEATIAALRDTFKTLTGRNIKNMLKLAIMTNTGEPYTVETFKFVSKFLDIRK